MENRKRRVLRTIEEIGPATHERIAENLVGCECYGSVDTQEQREINDFIRGLHRDGKVENTLDRRVEAA